MDISSFMTLRKGLKWGDLWLIRYKIKLKQQRIRRDVAKAYNKSKPGDLPK